MKKKRRLIHQRIDAVIEFINSIDGISNWQPLDPECRKGVLLEVDNNFHFNLFKRYSVKSYYGVDLDLMYYLVKIKQNWIKLYTTTGCYAYYMLDRSYGLIDYIKALAKKRGYRLTRSGLSINGRLIKDLDNIIAILGEE